MNHLLPILLAALTITAGCDDAQTQRIEETREKLAGTWLHESSAGDWNKRRVLSLQVDGKFVERIQVAGGNGEAEKLELAGEWSYDGMNLKRRYLQENGRQFSGGKMRFATFPLVEVSASSLVLDSTVERQQLGYRRVPEGTLP